MKALAAKKSRGQELAACWPMHGAGGSTAPAHVMEGLEDNCLIRPRADYVGPEYPVRHIPIDRRAQADVAEPATKFTVLTLAEAAGNRHLMADNHPPPVSCLTDFPARQGMMLLSPVVFSFEVGGPN